MANIRKALVGNRVYGGVRTSPNKGQVSAKGAQGYLKRELAKRKRGPVGTTATGKISRPIVRPKGGDGKSDSRSGVAANFLHRMRTMSKFKVRRKF